LRYFDKGEVAFIVGDLTSDGGLMETLRFLLVGTGSFASDIIELYRM
jgi:hypothetical protein